MGWNRVAIGLSVFALLCAGCGVTSDHPLTDEKTSVLDERLIGIWEGVQKAGEHESPERKKDPPRVFVGRVEGKENTLEAVFLQLEDERVKVERFQVYTTRLGEHHYVSAGKTGLGYVILLYELGEPDLLKLSVMKDDVFEAAIEKALLAGNVTHKKSEGLVDIETKTIRIEASPKELAAFIEAHSPACYRIDEPVTLRRIELD